ncbi:MAG: alpha-2-macroglobulin family protein [Alistipes onderdonkii]
MSLLFEAVNYQKARVRVRKIFANNLLQFFQQNYYDDQYYSSMDYVSRVVRDTTIDLGARSSTRLDQSNTYSLDLSRLITDSRKSMYLLEIRGVDPLTPVDDEYDYDYYFGDYRIPQGAVESGRAVRHRPHLQEQRQRPVRRLHDRPGLRPPQRGCKVRTYDRQNQMLAEASTDSEGRAVLRTKDEPYIVTAEAGGDVTFVKVEPGTALSLSNFDVGGTANPKGIKGYIFGERGVWRPGDDIHLTFIVTSDNPLPESHPASLEFFNPNGQLVQSLVNNSSSDGIYTFSLGTTPASPTGLWRAKITFGGAQFEKSVRVDAIKPNRMKIELKLGDGQLVDAAHFTGSLTARWLHGTPAADAKAVLQAQLSQIATRFKGYEGYSFDDASKYFGTEEREIVTGTTDAQGSLALSTDELSSLEGLSPGMLSGRFTVKVFEKSGDFSVDQQVATISPYDTYFGIGVATQKSDWGDEYLDSRKEHIIKVVMLDSKGKPEPGSENVLVSVYKMDSYWWWDASTPNSQAHYAKNALNSNYKTLQATLSNGTGTGHDALEHGRLRLLHDPRHEPEPGTLGDPDRMRVLVRLAGRRHFGDGCRHAARPHPRQSQIRPGGQGQGHHPLVAGRTGAGRHRKRQRRAGKLLGGVHRQANRHRNPRQGGMAPNIYVSVTLVQPHNSTLNDAPIRLFGVTRLDVEDAARRLTPVVEMPETVKPESEVTIKVREKNGRKMSYVLALVDEGLLGLTRFKTPDPYGYFNATEALGVRTWDMFDYVIGAYGGRIEQMFAIGGDAEQPNTGALKAQRFKPVVRFIDAQKLGTGKTNTHKITLPPYFGEVRVMVIASNGRAFGAAEKDVAVKKPLLVQATMPRVVSTDEEVEVPVTVFALEDGVGKVDVKIAANESFSPVGPSSKSITLGRSGEEVVSFRLKVNKRTGIGKVRVTAASSGDSSASEIELDVREPNPYVTLSKDYVIDPGKTMAVKPLKENGKAKLELSSIPPIDLSRRLEYLVRYPHGCIEQITSGAFPQLYLPSVVECDANMLQDIDRNVKSVLSRLGSYQLSDGAFAYWSGNTSRSEWGTVYATHFLIEAAKHGYGVDRAMLDRALKYLRSNPSDYYLTQAYTQYVLALNGTPTRGAMNQLREKAASLSSDAKWLLAAAYALDGNRKVAEGLISLCVDNAEKANPYDGTYNSDERRMSISLMTLTILGRREEAFRMALKMSDILKKDRWLSTQSTAWMLSTLSTFAVAGQNGIDATAGRELVKTDKSIASMPLAAPTEVRNNGSGSLYAVVSQSYTPGKGEETEAANGIRIDVRYTNMDGAAIDPASIRVSTDFYAIVTVSNTSGHERYADLALTHIFPAGWEITSERDLSSLTYQDIRDDRVLSYFDLSRGESKEIPVKLTATYKGRYYLPSVYCEAMYDNAVRALKKGQWVEVVD